MELNGNRKLYIAVFLVTLATMLFEILLTRVFSVTTFYHFAFLCIAAAMMGLAGGAIYVYKSPKLFNDENIYQRMSMFSLIFGLVSFASVISHICAPLIVGFSDPILLLIVSMVLAFPVVLAAFFASGVFVCLALTRFPKDLNKIYAFDLSGAACGCLTVVYLLSRVDLFICLLVGTLCSAVSALILLHGTKAARSRIVASIITVIISCLIIMQVVSAVNGHPCLRIMWSKGRKESNLIYEKWNAFSRIRVYGDRLTQPEPWIDATMSAREAANIRVPSLTIDIDANASTPMLHYDGKLESAAFLQDATTAIVHRMRPGADVAIIGMGGGKDVLTALINHQKHVLGLEINQDIIDVVTNKFGDYSGHFDRAKGVEIVCDDARCAITKINDKFDVIQASLVDTWAACSSGAYILSENGLYTLDCWRVFLAHMKPRGIITMTRWFEPNTPSVEFYRLTNLAAQALRESGITNLRQHIIIVRNRPAISISTHPVGTLIISKEPFSEEDLRLVDRICKEEGFELILTTHSSTDPMLERLLSPNYQNVVASYPFDISAPTDDKPFFFQVFSWESVFEQLIKGKFELITIAALLFVFIVLRMRQSIKQSWPLVLNQVVLSIYLFLIGLGFMLIEISQMQRLTIFLGHPNYGLSVALFTFLLGGAFGSLIGGKIAPLDTKGISIRFAAILVVLLISGCFASQVLQMFSFASTLGRVCVAIALMFPVGFAIGIPFPLGMSIASLRYQWLTPWLWGVNGIASVLGSILAVALTMTIGISATFFAAIFLYALAYAAAFIAMLPVTR